ncbi:MAG TPA: N-acetylmuramoyl-L-alanine amidase [Vicinamibacterales bacterium]|nr:N-acetylmuramoyl-L-alanine amidase [Vicinamibacterales bacterium]
MTRILALLLLCLWPAVAAAQSAKTQYDRLQTREQAARSAKPSASATTTLRTVAKQYEALVRKYPTSGYSDNALLQGAGLYELAFARGRSAADRAEALRLLTWLRKEYPTSSLIATAAARANALEPAPAAAPPTAATKPSGPPPSPRSLEADSTAAPAAAPAEAAAEAAAEKGLPPPQAGAPQGPAALVKAIVRSALPRGDRVTIELSREIDFTGDRVANPDRVFFDLQNAMTPASVSDGLDALKGSLVSGVRVGRPVAGMTRVVIDVKGAPRYSVFPMYNPFRLVIDLEADSLPVEAPPSRPADEPAAATPSAPAPASSTSKGSYSLARQLGLGVSRIVIDAGHGGHDPGARANGINEKELVLDVAQRLRKLLLDQPGFEVVLTRDNDTYIALEERTAIANRQSADLFLSIHANASRRAAARGVETYFLNFATNPDAEAVAARENASSSQSMGTLPAILRAIAMNNKLAESRELASMVQTSMVRRLSSQNAGAKDLGVKQAPFVVLIGAQMPSVLAEISFLTNKSEAALLKTPSYRQRIAQALCDAVLKYQSSLKKVTAPIPTAAR